MTDKYINFADLAANEVLNVDYRISFRQPAGAAVAHIAIHGGAIEPAATQLADSAANMGSYAYYSFEGIKSSGNGFLHITSTHFDEPNAIVLVGGLARTISWHGASGTTPQTYVGGRDATLKSKVIDQLVAAGFTVAPDTPPELNANDPLNITNKNSSHMGVQLELTKAQREQFFTNGQLNRTWIENPANRTPVFAQYVTAVNNALA